MLQMEPRRIGRTDIRIAPLVLGGNVFGWTANEQASYAILDRFLELGFSAIDTSNNYSRWVPGNCGGESEQIIGKWMRDRGTRQSVTIITKVGSDIGQGRRDLSARHIEEAIEASLRRLQTDHVDLYLSHWCVPETHFEETLGAYEILIRKGKVRWCGASNHDASQLAAAFATSRERSLPRYEMLEVEHNIYDRSAFNGELRDLCLRDEIGVIVYYALAQGFLTGKYRSAADLAGAVRGNGVQRYLNDRGLRILAALDVIAGRYAVTVAEVVLAWTMAQPAITAPIVSATRVDQVDSFARSLSISLSDEDLAAIEDAAGETP